MKPVKRTKEAFTLPRSDLVAPPSVPAGPPNRHAPRFRAAARWVQTLGSPGRALPRHGLRWIG